MLFGHFLRDSAPGKVDGCPMRYVEIEESPGDFPLCAVRTRRFPRIACLAGVII